MMEVSVWIILKGVPSTLMVRFTLETMPPLMENVRSPRGLPMARTRSPTFSFSLSPRVTACRPEASILMTAMS